MATHFRCPSSLTRQVPPSSTRSISYRAPQMDVVIPGLLRRHTFDQSTGPPSSPPQPLPPGCRPTRVSRHISDWSTAAHSCWLVDRCSLHFDRTYLPSVTHLPGSLTVYHCDESSHHSIRSSSGYVVSVRPSFPRCSHHFFRQHLQPITRLPMTVLFPQLKRPPSAVRLRDRHDFCESIQFPSRNASHSHPCSIAASSFSPADYSFPTRVAVLTSEG